MATVSVIIPCYNEEETIFLLLDALYNQSFSKDSMEVIIVDGMSKDNTRLQIESFIQKHRDFRVRILDNPAKKIPHALNIGIQAAKEDIIVRLDAHSIPNKNYIELCVQDLSDGKAINVGGVWEIQPSANTWVAKGIALAAGHPIGVGDAKYRFTTSSQYVDTVPFGSYYKESLLDIGGFDENMVANEDYDLNARILSNGGKIWLNVKIRAKYFARATIKLLAQQYWRYGFWKVKMLIKYPKTVKPRQAIPPIFFLALLLGPIISNFYPVLRLPYLVGVVIYGVVLISVGIQSAMKQKYLANLISVPLAIFTMHLFWGGAFVWSLVEEIFIGFRNGSKSTTPK
jgi:succinoglycan biosynthesis protein ExoA